ncbi:MAG: metallophosphoesterase family protein [Desulforhopalus sp.]
MRIAALSDIHSNVFALKAVLADVEKQGADLLINLGDIFYGPIAPRATYELLRQYDVVTISGNQDRLISETSPEDINANPTLGFVADALGPEPVEWLKSLPFDKQLTEDVYLCHGTPADDAEYLLEDIASGYPLLRPEKKIIEMLSGQSSEVTICGHSHIPRTVSLAKGSLIVNPGSVGLPAYTDDEPVVHSMENYCPHASYAMLEKDISGWFVQHMKVPYDFQRAAEECTKQQRRDWAHFLTTGRGC